MILKVLFLRTEATSDVSKSMPLVWVSKLCSMVLSPTTSYEACMQYYSGEVTHAWDLIPSTVVHEHLALSPSNHCYSLRKPGRYYSYARIVCATVEVQREFKVNSTIGNSPLTAIHFLWQLCNNLAVKRDVTSNLHIHNK